MARPTDIHRLTQAAATGGALILGVLRARAGSSRLLVFLHLPLKQRALQKMLSSALPGVSVTTVGRIADFDRALSAGQDAVLSLPVVLNARGLKPQLRGRRNGATEEPYSLVGASGTPSPSSVSVVGALDVLGRSGTKDFVKQVMGTLPRVERVTKVEDLLALLQMQRADAIILPSRLASALRQMSRLNLSEQQLGKRVGLPAVSGTGPGASAVFSAIDKMGGAALRTLGVDGWR